jgi:DNA-binding NtrC family response regulator
MKTLLLIDDEPTMSILAECKLSGRFEILEATSVAEALDVFRSHRSIDLLICETKLQPVSGMELASLLMASNFRLRTILMTDLPHDQWTRQQEKELGNCQQVR